MASSKLIILGRSVKDATRESGAQDIKKRQMLVTKLKLSRDSVWRKYGRRVWSGDFIWI
jgi:hypothetical protein